MGLICTRLACPMEQVHRMIWLLRYEVPSCDLTGIRLINLRDYLYLHSLNAEVAVFVTCA